MLEQFIPSEASNACVSFVYQNGNKLLKRNWKLHSTCQSCIIIPSITFFWCRKLFHKSNSYKQYISIVFFDGFIYFGFSLSEYHAIRKWKWNLQRTTKANLSTFRSFLKVIKCRLKKFELISNFVIQPPCYNIFIQQNCFQNSWTWSLQEIFPIGNVERHDDEIF